MQADGQTDEITDPNAPATQVTNDTAGEEETKQPEESKEIIEVEQAVSVEDMDSRVLEAFYRSLIESVRPEDLPMEPADYKKNHFAEYTCDEFQLDLRKSSFKKIGKLLE